MNSNRVRRRLGAGSVVAATTALLLAGLFALAASGQVTYTYDDAGRLIRSADQNEVSKAYTLDAAGNRVQVQKIQGAGVLQFTSAAYSIAENGGTPSILVARTGVLTGAVSVQYTAMSGTAVSGTDFTATAGTLSWASGDGASKAISVPITDDASFEGAETFSIALSAPTGGAAVGSISSSVVTIADNDSVTLSIANVSVNENAGTATFTVTKSGTSGMSHNVNYATANGTASAGTDYSPATGTLVFAAGDVTKTFSVSILNDSTFEGAEAFTASLSSPTNGASLGTSVGTATITDDDTVSFSITGVSVSENASTATLTVTKTGATTLTHAVNYATANGTAVAGSDYTSASGTLSFLSSDVTKTFTVAIADDSTFELSEVFAATLSGPTNGASLGTASANVTIQDNDTAPYFTIGNSSGYESTGNASVTVSRVGASAVTQTVNVATSNSTAVAGSDYTATSITLSFAAGETSKSFNVPVASDAVYEGSESFLATLSSPTSGATLGAGADVATVTIVDGDSPPSFAVNDLSIDESGVWANVTVTKIGASIFTHDVTITTSDGTATSSADYSASATTLSFGPTESSKVLAVRVWNDNLAEANETFIATLTAPTNAATLSDATATITIVNDDAVSSAPPAPTAVVAPSKTTSTSVGFSWPSVEGATSYELWDSTSTPVRKYAGSSTATTLTLAQGFVYQFYAKACNAFACSSPSPVKQVTVDCPVSCL